jgi:LDH2 family malate/lactate/ureidoglycolate dehydrogenase
LTKHFSPEKAKRIAEPMLWAEMHGKNSQGLLKLTGSEPLTAAKPTGELEITNRTQVSISIKANSQPSFYAAQIGTDILIEKALQAGFSVVGINGVHTSCGTLGFYVERMAKAGLIGFMTARSSGCVAPFGGLSQLYGTNPLAFGFPTAGEPLTFDMATAAITWYGLVLARMRGETIPAGRAVDKKGRPTIDPAAAMQGGILPFGGDHKGAGLSMMVEMLSGPLVGASYCDTEATKDWGIFLLAFKPDLLVDAEEFRHHASQLVELTRNQPRIDANVPVRVPGDAAAAFAAKVEKTGVLEIEDEVAVILGI